MSSEELTYKRVKLTRNKKTKKERYQKERGTIMSELNKLLKFDEGKTINKIMLYEIEENKELKTRLIQLSEKEIKKYYSYGKWGYYCHNNENENENENENNKHEKVISLLKRLYIDDGYIISGKNKLQTKNEIKKQYTQLIFSKP